MQGKVVLCFSLKIREPDEVELWISAEIHHPNDIPPEAPRRHPRYPLLTPVQRGSARVQTARPAVFS